MPTKKPKNKPKNRERERERERLQSLPFPLCLLFLIDHNVFPQTRERDRSRTQHQTLRMDKGHHGCPCSYSRLSPMVEVMVFGVGVLPSASNQRPEKTWQTRLCPLRKVSACHDSRFCPYGLGRTLFLSFF